MACLPVFNRAYLLHHWDTSISVIHGGTRPVSRDVALIILVLQLLSFYGFERICLLLLFGVIFGRTVSLLAYGLTPSLLS